MAQNNKVYSFGPRIKIDTNKFVAPQPDPALEEAQRLNREAIERAFWAAEFSSYTGVKFAQVTPKSKQRVRDVECEVVGPKALPKPIGMLCGYPVVEVDNVPGYGDIVLGPISEEEDDEQA